MKTNLLLVLFLCCSTFMFSQNNITFNFNHLLSDQAFAYDQATTVEGDYEVKIDRLEFYISEITITHDGGTITAIDDVYLLVQPNVENTYDLGSWDINSVENVQFGFGVDPSVNTADPAQWPSDHPLSYQVPSMHWGWSSGYRFLAIEGSAGADFLYNFEIHALGNANYGMINLTYDGLAAVNGNLAIGINADYSKIFNQVNVQFGSIVHSTSDPKAVQSLNNCKTIVFSPEGSTASLNEIETQTQLIISPNPIQNDQLKIQTNINYNTNLTVTVYNAVGELVYHEMHSNDIIEIDIAQLENGYYMVSLQNENGDIISKPFIK